MSPTEPKSHWEKVYAQKLPTELSWYQDHLQMSLRFTERTGVGKSASIIDVGGGASTLVDDLLDRGFERLTVLDVSPKAIELARARLGINADKITWIEADITRVSLPQNHYDLWHDRAVFHFLTGAEDRQKYLELVKDSLKPGGHIIIATFAPDGPPKCSGLDVVRYSPDSLLEEFGSDFELIESAREGHLTPSGAKQRFIYCYLRKN